MRILLDSCSWHGVRDELSAAGHDVAWVGDWPRDPGDVAVLAHAHAEGRVLVTLDKDFGDLVFVRRRPHAGIVRLVDLPTAKQAEVCLLTLVIYEADLVAGAIVTANLTRVRISRASSGHG